MARIKINDLSVGDWVRCNGIDCRVACVDGVLNRIGFIDKIRTEYIAEIEPIPLTPDILEKNGWLNDGMYAILRIDEHLHLEYYYHDHRLRKWYCGIDEWNNHASVDDIVFKVQCFSVHQLQHALRLAGADKEINL